MNFLKTFGQRILPVLIMFLMAGPVVAQGNLGNADDVLKGVAEGSGVTQGDLGTVAGTIINAALTLVGLIFLILMVYAGFLWMTARGESDQVDKAKKIIAGSLIGLVIVLSAYAITVFVTTGFTG